MEIDQEGNDLLRLPTDREYPIISRSHSSYAPLQTFDLEKEKHYQQQYADLYFLRLARLKPAVEEVATEVWADFEIAGEKARRVDRVLDVRQGELCWVAGTIYMDMPLKPNILEDISKDHWISAPPPRAKYTSPDGQDQVMIEDESGRLQLKGTPLQAEMLVTGCIVAVLGTENANGEFEVIDMKVPDLAPQPARWTKVKSPAKPNRTSNKIALLSGLDISVSSISTLSTEILLEYLLGESLTPKEQASAAQISRLIICGNSLSDAAPLPTHEDISAAKKQSKKYGYDSSAYNSAPIIYLDKMLSTLLSSIPVTLLPGSTDPANVSLPQQPIHSAMFPESRAFAVNPVEKSNGGVGWFDAVTNPWEGEIEGWRFLAAGGQTADDIFKYVESEDRLEMMERMLRWRCCAPTAPDTLWCYPFQDKDAFVIEECPHVFVVGNQPKFDTEVIEGPAGQQVRLVAMPKFSETGQLVLLDSETLEIEIVHFDVSKKV